MKHNLDIALFVPGLPFTDAPVHEQSLGGSESAGLYMARALAKAGHRVSLFCTLKDGKYGQSESVSRLTYLPVDGWQAYTSSVPHDVTIAQRVPQALSHRCNSLVQVMWSHDLAVGREVTTFKGMMWNCDAVFVLSRFMQEQYHHVYNIEKDRLVLTHNGIDLDRFKGLERKESDNPVLVYAARPERGLDVLLEHVMPKVLAKHPNAQLLVAGYDNPVQHMAAFYNKCRSLAARLGPAVKFVGALPKQQLYELYSRATAYVYPTPSPQLANFAEVSCISAMECMAAGLPVVTCNVGALPETLDPQAAKIVSDPGKDWSAFADAVNEVIADKSGREAMSTAGKKRAQGLDWSLVAAQWTAWFFEEIKENNSNYTRLFRHLWRQSDIVAHDYLFNQLDEQQRLPLINEKRFVKDWAFMHEADGYRTQYESIGVGHDTWVIDTAPREPRFGLLARWLAEKQGEVKRVLDYGCAHGAYATRLAEQLPWLKIHGVDIDKHSVDMARDFAKKLNVEDRATFETWGSGIPDKASKLYDCVLAQEVLEHVPEPWKVLEQLEQHVKQDGYVYVTVPFGPWEYSSYLTYPYRCHIWHFSRHDLEDMVGHRTDFAVDAFFAGPSQELGDAMGWWIVSYKADGGGVREIDMERKCRMQRPRQLLSVQILGGPNAEETLLWNLRSLKHLADEIILLDTGLSPDIVEIARKEDKLGLLRVIKGPDPKAVGFDEARNFALERTGAGMDWVLWIDTDEKLLDQVNLQKYLRANCYNGYGIRQHHFAVDAPLTPDMPVRMFRAPKATSKPLRFFGVIHEHPESELNAGPGDVIVVTDSHIAHVGYLVESTRKGRFHRNLPLLERDIQKYPERLIQKHFIIRDKIHIIRYILGSNGGVITEDIKRMAQEVVDMYRQHFLGKRQFLNSDSLAYYSEAVAILGEGFELAYTIEADKVNATPGAPKKYRFASLEDATTELGNMVKEKASRFENPHY